MNTNWEKTLNTVIFCHKENTIEFSMKDIEDLKTQLTLDRLVIENQTKRIKQLQKENDMQRTQLLAAALETTESVKISKFKIYA